MADVTHTMSGVSIRRPADQRYVRSDFAVFFAPIFPRLRRLFWLVDGQAFVPPIEVLDNDLALFEARCQVVGSESNAISRDYMEPHIACGPAFVEEYAEWCNDNWCYLYGFDQPPSDYLRWIRANQRIDGPNWQAERAAFLTATTSVCFFAVDGAYWEFFAHDRELVADASRTAIERGLIAGPAALHECACL